MWEGDQDCLRTPPAVMADGELEWLRIHSLLALTSNLCNTTIAAATGCSFYDKIAFVELSEREAGSYLAKSAFWGKPAASPAVPTPSYSGKCSVPANPFIVPYTFFAAM